MKTTKYFLIALLLLGICGNAFAQLPWLQAQQDPKPNEKVLGEINNDHIYNDNVQYNDQTAYDMLLRLAKEAYKKDNIDLRKMRGGCDGYHGSACWDAIVVEVLTVNDYISNALDKALLNIKEGSRLALDQIRITNGNKEDFKDQIVEILLNEGYKVVAKEYLDRLYEEQQSQQSGIYNDRTTVQENNFSAVGYYINVKKSDTSIKVQIINVSTGEYESNVTVSID